MPEPSVNLPVRSFENFEESLEYNKANDWPDVTWDAKLLINNLVVERDIRKAAKEAGMVVSRARSVLEDRLNAAYHAELMKQVAEISLLDRAFLEQQLLETLGQVNGDIEVPIVDRDGNVHFVRKFDAASKVSLLKDMKNFVGVSDQNKGSGSVTVQLNFGAAGYREEKDASVTIEGDPVVGG